MEVKLRMNHLGLILFTLFMIELSFQLEKSVYRWNNFELSQNKSFVDVNYFLNATKSGSYVLNFNATTFFPLQNAFIQNSIQFLNANGQYEQFMGKGLTDLCKFLSFRKGNKIMRIIFDKIKGEQNFPSSCPIKPDTYYANNIVFDGNSSLFQYVGDAKVMALLDFGTKIKGKMIYFVNIKVFVEFIERVKWEREQLKNKTKAEKKKH
ncbi:CLUMA_CG001212, isoform A [Clunio marinus]|uniref:CLUMA_CG001212, isoform A n=1 Tax=Clunio marinus TaxID=568069 RepID=A0A1J1HIM6_9DIPT|nr:CLUMA_CG001212, isoform A [Clunio marinus]